MSPTTNRNHTVIQIKAFFDTSQLKIEKPFGIAPTKHKLLINLKKKVVELIHYYIIKHTEFIRVNLVLSLKFMLRCNLQGQYQLG